MIVEPRRADEWLSNVHPERACEGRPCTIHHPSDHHMVDWPLNWRGDRNLFERICPHGIGHPDPDSLTHIQGQARILAERLDDPEIAEELMADAEAEGIHGCCGCCAEPR